MKTKLLPSLSEVITKDVFEIKYNGDHYKTIIKFNNFLEKRQELGMFVPCDKEGKPMREPQQGVYGNEQYEACEWRDYQQALDRVIFHGFEIIGTKNFYHLEMGNGFTVVYDKIRGKFLKYKTIADLSGKVYLNENGIKDSGI